MNTTPALTLDEEFMTINDVCHLLKVTKSWIYQHTYKGRQKVMPHTKVGRMLRFKKSEVMTYINQMNEKGESPCVT